MLEGAAALEHIVPSVSPDKILFGSHCPMLYFESALLKLQESAMPVPHVRAITHENARKLRSETG
jgi:predicted TIM-barrel fold metal-dependent hydrolase